MTQIFATAQSYNIYQSLNLLKDQLTNIVDPEIASLEAQFMLSQALDLNSSQLIINSHQQLTTTQLEQLQQWCSLRLTGMPLTHVLGNSYFWDDCFKVTKDTLAPRPATELLIEKSLELVAQQPALQQQLRFLDLGTGTGAIAISLIKELQKCYKLGDFSGVAVDASLAALAVAQENQQLLGVGPQLLMRHSNWFSELDPKQKFDLIISNPPYLDPQDQNLKELIPFEPLSALVAEQQGLADLARIIQDSPNYLATAGYLLLEHGYQQGEAVSQLFADNKFFKAAEAIYDYAGHWRATYAQLN